ncbi:MAG: TlpA family protein disulfide reductase [Ilumatobacteraceae bacterium]
MANRKRAEARRKAAAKAQGGGGGKTWMWVTIAAVVVVAIVGVVIATSGGDDNTPAAGDSTTSTVGGLADLPTSQPVTVTGDPLPAFDSAKSPDPAVGTSAPVLDGKNFNGQDIKVDAADGAYMLVFLAHWCPHCNAEVPRLIDWRNSGAVPEELRVIGVATAVSPTAVNFPPAQWFSNKGWPWPVLVDESQGDAAAGKAAQAYGATGWPYFVIVGKDGKVKVRVSGEVEITDLQKIVDQALAN